jgi:transposase
MKRGHYIGLDTHAAFTELVAVNASGEVVRKEKCATNIPTLTALLRLIARPRFVVFEEGPLAGWLYRNLRGEVDELTVCEPRRNRLIAADGDKDDPIDARKLADLLRGGFVKVVHQTDTLERAVFKQHVMLYHGRVRQRVREALRIISLFRRHGVMIRERAFVAASERRALLARLPAAGVLHADVKMLWKGYDVMVWQEERARRLLAASAQDDEVMCRFEALPGIGWVRAATLFVMLDTPWRFVSKQALWKYLGIGLERRHSGVVSERVRLPSITNRLLKGTILGAAKSAIAQGENPFADQYRKWVEQGLSVRLARRNVARSLSATLWGLWKNGTAYRPNWVGVAAAAITADSVSTAADSCIMA